MDYCKLTYLDLPNKQASKCHPYRAMYSGMVIAGARNAWNFVSVESAPGVCGRKNEQGGGPQRSTERNQRKNNNRLINQRSQGTGFRPRHTLQYYVTEAR